MLHRHVNAMEYIENNIAVPVTIYGINQERRYYEKKIQWTLLYEPRCEKTGLITKTCPCNIQQYFMAIKTEISD